MNEECHTYAVPTNWKRVLIPWGQLCATWCGNWTQSSGDTFSTLSCWAILHPMSSFLKRAKLCQSMRNFHFPRKEFHKWLTRHLISRSTGSNSPAERAITDITGPWNMDHLPHFINNETKEYIDSAVSWVVWSVIQGSEPEVRLLLSSDSSIPSYM